jgi:hypothetical protein
MMNEDILQFQLNCQEEDSEVCENCSFFNGCQKKYELRKNNKELCLVLTESIVIFPNKSKLSEFCNTYNINQESRNLSIEEILDLINKLDLEVITFS